MNNTYIIFLLSLFVVGACNNKNEKEEKEIPRPKILIIHSLHQNHNWTKSVNEGIEEAFLGHKVEFKKIYMDTEHNPSIQYKVNKGIEIVDEYKKYNPDVVVTVDDDARYYFSNKVIHDPNINLVFCGVTDTVRINKSFRPDFLGYYAQRSSNETGVLVRPNVVSLVKLTQDLIKNYQGKKSDKNHDILIAFAPGEAPEIMAPTKKKPKENVDEKPKDLLDTISVITDNTTQSLAFLEHLKNNKHKLKVHIQEVVSTSDVYEWERVVANITSDALVMFSCQELYEKDLTHVDPHEVANWTAEICKVPTLSFNKDAVDKGFFIAYAPDGFQQGYEAGKICQKIISGTPIKKIPIIIAESGRFIANRNASKKNRVDLSPFSQSIKIVY